VLLILCSGGIGVAMNLTGSVSPVYELTGTIGFTVLVIAFALPMRRDLAAALAPRRLVPSATLVALLAAGGLLIFIHLYLAGFSLLSIEQIPLLDQYEASEWPLWSALLMVGVAPAVFEEIAFRGIIYERLQRVGGPREALVMQAAMFSIIHLLPASFISHFVIGLTLGWLRQRTGSILPGMITHYVYNTSVLLIELA
jgi:membrane protease YdiL (CAAX protease family)